MLWKEAAIDERTPSAVPPLSRLANGGEAELPPLFFLMFEPHRVPLSAGFLAVSKNPFIYTLKPSLG